jgi:hypothetical protein
MRLLQAVWKGGKKFVAAKLREILKPIIEGK